jgi:sugar phosphate isomerase/epimerase
LIGTTVSHYRVVEKLGEGGMDFAYKTPLNRRAFLSFAGGWATASLVGCSQPEPASDQSPFEFVPHIVGASTASIRGAGFFEAIDVVQGLGFRTLEVLLVLGRLEATPDQYPGFRFDELTEEQKEKIRAALMPFDQVTVHLPFSGSYTLPDDDDAVADLEMSIAASGFMGAKVAVLHPQPRGTRDRHGRYYILTKQQQSARLEENRQTVIERTRKWGSMAADRGLQLACETSVPPSIPGLVRFIEEINHDNVGVTLDVGHQSGFEELSHIKPEEYGTPEGIKAYNDVNVKIVETLGDKLFHLHVHDIEPDTWNEHKPLVHGFVDYPRLLSALRRIQYPGVLIFEIAGEGDKMPEYLRDSKQKLDGYLGASA